MTALQFLLRFARERSGATVIEYCLIAGIIALAVVGGASALGDNANNTFNELNTGVWS